MLLVAIVIALVTTYSDWFDSFKNRTNDITAPLYWVTNFPQKAEGWADNRFMSREKLIQENESLRTEILVLRRKVQQIASLAADNTRLRQLLHSADTLEDRVLIAELIGVSPDPNEHKVIINRGSSQGVYVGQAVLDATGLMGQVVEVGKSHSKALLITDVNHSIPVQINRNGVRLIAKGVGDLFELDIPHVADTQDVQVGDLLVSSGLGQRFPVGYPVAKVTKVERSPGETFAKVIAKPMAYLNRSRHVLLVFHTSNSDVD